MATSLYTPESSHEIFRIFNARFFQHKESRNWRLYRIKRRSSHRYFSRSLQYPNLSESIVLLFDYSRISEIVHPLTNRWP